MPKSSGYVSPEYLQMIASVIKPFKDNSYRLMNIKDGDTVFDLGCGPGCDTKEMAVFVGDTGKVYGVDIDEEMVAIADKEVMKAGLANRVVHLVGSVQKLPFEDNYFDSCRAERLFQVIPANIERHLLFTEIRRVLKPGGKLVLIDTDWGTSTVDFPDSELERKLMTF
ncbi:MAG: methyltransferase domain-containing protein, partial [Fibrobacter sp.]|nr:methyltransferase domain-containing protein [Fibrobacter sp.]